MAERGYEHVRHAPPHDPDGRQQRHEAADQRIHQPGRTGRETQEKEVLRTGSPTFTRHTAHQQTEISQMRYNMMKTNRNLTNEI